ncbi:hypothetical protein NIES4073_37940 [Kalymmatonema gypsitolerans NIES-4073]|nr:hypothetical protein NIES4073_37940 [Scytonema sp. NIES-4073]
MLEVKAVPNQMTVIKGYMNFIEFFLSQCQNHQETSPKISYELFCLSQNLIFGEV